MNAWAESAPRRSRAARCGPQTRLGWRESPLARDSLALRLAAFCGLAGFASLQYATLLLHPPGARVAAVTAIATLGAAGLGLSARVAGPRLLAPALAALVAVLTLAAGLLACGIPPGLLLPVHWPALADDLHRGFRGLAGWLWPYRGTSQWSRLTVLALLPVTLTAAACISFWPARRARPARQLLALALLLTLFITGAANETEPAWAVQGAALAALIAAWLWLPALAAGELNRAAVWLLACSALALGVAPALSASGSWIDYRTWNPIASTTSFQWDQTYGPIRWPRSTATMFEVSETQPSLLRVTSLDRFDGERFTRSPSPPGLPAADLHAASGDPRWLAHATVTMGQLRSNLLVSGGGLPTEVRWLGGRRERAEAQADGTVTLASAPGEGDAYEVISYAPDPTAAVLRAAPRAYPRAYLAYTQIELPPATGGARSSAPPSAVQAPAAGSAPASDPSLARALEGSPYAPTFALARRLASGARTSYDVAVRVKQFLLHGYAYAENVPAAPLPLQAFLFAQRRGYCQQFSGAMTLILRMDGIPARVGVGFKPQVYDPFAQRWTVRALDAHEWVEVFFAGVGWVPFDPTPPRALPAIATGRVLAGNLALLSPRRRGAAEGTGIAAAAPIHARPRSSTSAGWPLWLVLGLSALGLCAVACAGWWIGGAARLRRGLRGDASGAVAELGLALARIGYPASRATTLAALEARLGDSRHGGAGSYLRGLAELRYGRAGAARPTRAQRRDLRRALGESGGLRTRVRALLALPPGAARRAHERAW